jgi:molecular chaperone GrpE
MAEEKEDRTKQTGKNPEEGEIIEGEVIDVEETEVEPEDLLVEELQQAQEKAKEFFEGWQRERADFANYKRRIERDQQLMSQNMKGDIIKKYLGVLDDLERALKARPVEGPAASWSNGIELIQRKLQGFLEAEGVKRIPAEDEAFDPTRHEAITHEDSPDHESGEIIEVVQQGYTLGDRVLRPAMVRVAR